MARVTPKIDWTVIQGVTWDDLNRIEGNILQMFNEIDALSGDVSDHVGDATIHKTAAEVRADSDTEFRVECRTSDPVDPAIGREWLRTDL